MVAWRHGNRRHETAIMAWRRHPKKSEIVNRRKHLRGVAAAAAAYREKMSSATAYRRKLARIGVSAAKKMNVKAAATIDQQNWQKYQQKNDAHARTHFAHRARAISRVARLRADNCRGFCYAAAPRCAMQLPGKRVSPRCASRMRALAKSASSRCIKRCASRNMRSAAHRPAQNLPRTTAHTRRVLPGNQALAPPRIAPRVAHINIGVMGMAGGGSGGNRRIEMLAYGIVNGIGVAWRNGA